MAGIEPYTIALERSTRPGLSTEHNEAPPGIARLSDAERAACGAWLQEVNFLRPGKEEHDEVWEKIKRNWVGYLSATSPTPEAALAPNRKVIQFRNDDEDEGNEEEVAEQRRRFADDRRRRTTVEAAFWNGLDGIEAMTERWPQAARAALNSMDGGDVGDGGDRCPGAFESLAAVYDLGERRRYQSMWTSLVGFIAHSLDEGTLEEMGMRLTESQVDDILDVEQEIWQVDLRAIARRRGKGGFENVWAPIQQLLMEALRKPESTPRNNPILWWVAVLTRSAVSEDDDDSDGDFISQGRFHRNPMPMDIDLAGRLQAMVHYSKVLVLDDAFSTWSGEPRWIMEVQNRLNMVSIEWINDEQGSRPDGPPGDGGSIYSTAAWRSVLAHITEHTKAYLGGRQRTAVHGLRILANAIQQA